MTGFSTAKDLNREARTKWSDNSGSLNLNTADNMERYPLMEDKERPLDFHNHNKKSATFETEGLETE